MLARVSAATSPPATARPAGGGSGTGELPSPTLSIPSPYLTIPFSLSSPHIAASVAGRFQPTPASSVAELATQGSPLSRSTSSTHSIRFSLPPVVAPISSPSLGFRWWGEVCRRRALARGSSRLRHLPCLLVHQRLLGFACGATAPDPSASTTLSPATVRRR